MKQGEFEKIFNSAFDGSVSKYFDDNAENRIKFLKSISPGSHIHISGICGTGTGAVLQLLKHLGFYVSGSDKAFYPPMGDIIRKTADKIYTEFNTDNLNPRPEVVVIGNALSRDNVEVQHILKEKIPYCSMPEVFSALLIGTREECATSIVVSGTHGKTTTSSLIASVLSDAGRNPGYFIGGVPTNSSLDGSIRVPPKEMDASKRIVVLEGDEYDSAFFAKYSKFHCYRPDIAVITNIEFDHGDIFENLGAIEAEFKSMILKIPGEKSTSCGRIVACRDSENVRKLLDDSKNNPSKIPILWYGESREGELSNGDISIISRKPWVYQQVPEKRSGQEIEYNLSGHKITVRTRLTGLHNALNIAATILVVKELGVGIEIARKSLENYTPVLRRQQIIAEKNNLLLIEDFAHHPTEVKVTLEGLRSAYPDKRLIAVFEPRSNTSRRDFFREEYKKALSVADIIVLKEVLESKSSFLGVSSEKALFNVLDLSNELEKSGKTSFSSKNNEEIVSFIEKNMRAGDLIVIMSNGDFGGMPDTLKEKVTRS
ncbi:MAG TPA: Mur ligase family protein [Oligoflexia bacterium]|nr:Mur ligase family protein [Oligoflexia bacterium]HMP48148.1 Mur ligase family protein [Oligoflexia bacterium]